MKRSVKKNYILNLIYEVYALIIPLAVTPYVSRVLGENASGRYSFTYSICTYFTLFAALGFNRYAQRLIAQYQGMAEKQSIAFYEIIIARFFSVGFTLIVYYALIIFDCYDAKYSQLMTIMSINIIAVAFDIAFFFQGNEEFGKIVFRNIIIKTSGFICIFAFVKGPNDLWIYTLIQSLIVGVNAISLWVYMPRYLVKIEWRNIRPLRHIPKTLVLFLPTIATSVYTSLDKTLIGIITANEVENGNYEYASQLVRMAMTVITSLGTVMIPRNSQQIASGNLKKVEDNIYYSSRFVFFVGIPLTFGLMAISEKFMPWYLGPGYDKAALLVMILSPLIIIVGLSNVFGLQFLIPNNEDKKFTMAIILGAVTNFLLNCIMIKNWGSYGAALASIIAELVVTITMLIMVRKHIDFVHVLLDSWKYFLSGSAMYLVCSWYSRLFSFGFMNLILTIIIGALVYFGLLLILRDEYLISTCTSQHISYTHFPE